MKIIEIIKFGKAEEQLEFSLLLLGMENEKTAKGKLFGISFKVRFPGVSDCKESACNPLQLKKKIIIKKESACSVGDPGLIPESRRSSGEGNGSPLQNSCLKNSMERGKKHIVII